MFMILWDRENQRLGFEERSQWGFPRKRCAFAARLFERFFNHGGRQRRARVEDPYAPLFSEDRGDPRA